MFRSNGHGRAGLAAFFVVLCMCSPAHAGVKSADGAWTSLSANVPAHSARREHIAIYDAANNRYLMFGGYGYDSAHNLLPFNDLWKFSAGQWTWMGGPSLAGAYGSYGTLGVASATNIPGARFESARWTDTAGDLWLFGGIGFDSAGNERSMNDTADPV